MYLRKQFLEHIAQTSEIPQGFEIERSQGVYLYDQKGIKYLDLISGFGVNNIGHSVLEVQKAISEQSEKYLHSTVYGEHVQSPQVQLARYLCSLLPSSLNSCYFLSSGSECVDAFIKLARIVTGKIEIVVCKNAYHGSTIGAESLRSDEKHKSFFRPLIPGIRFITFGNEQELQSITEKTAAVITEFVQAEGGVLTSTNSYWQKLKNQCVENCCLFAIDEIQTGMGRTGKLFAFEHSTIIPDILLSGKALGAGLPLSAIICSKNLMEAFSKKSPLGYITTFGGNPVCCAAGLAGLKYLINNKIVNEVGHKSKLFFQHLKHKDIIEIRSSGLLMALQLESEPKLISWIRQLYDKKILAESFLFCSSALRIAPPLTISEDEILMVCEQINSLQ